MTKKMVGIRCQCSDPAVKRRGSGMRTVMCPICGRIYRTDREDQVCFNCRKGRS
ncbi:MULTISPECIES: hypothetical protein [Methanothermobacter]|jgi:uncharacterized Zn finger protein (UPF0148 family)|nr:MULTISPECIES: hypothetical protein [Methanothermobacter]MBC7111794.1 hypothetical protein [Methanothermobacter sp.]MDI6818259.1 hypothetical protein [Methanothermobacter thermautotrophicus]WBF05891.1 hypothetical protein ISG35_06520 [Methanothermobacter thermautotrophicus]WBF07682.1 hypothetical protein ISG36_06615 [Methanothermobacter thermautotrophicus]HIH70517.1 hypothetical protein [Methanothermobacter thermautotrophicus]